MEGSGVTVWSSRALRFGVRAASRLRLQFRVYGVYLNPK